MQSVTWEFYPGVKRQGRETDYFPPSNIGVKNGGAVLLLSHTLHSVELNQFVTALPFTFYEIRLMDLTVPRVVITDVGKSRSAVFELPAVVECSCQIL
jgi:hypothetical protein